MDLFNNYLIRVGVLSWFSAQFLKVIITFVTTRKINIERFFGSGGMPSSHSALVCSVVVGSAKLLGMSSPIFALALFLALIVMYDAIGVRRQAGEHAKILNKILNELSDDIKIIISGGKFKSKDKLLKELIGHTPMQVLCGAVLGVGISLIYPI